VLSGWVVNRYAYACRVTVVVKTRLKLFLSVIQPLRSMVKVKAELSDTVKSDLSEVLGWTRNL